MSEQDPYATEIQKATDRAKEKAKDVTDKVKKVTENVSLPAPEVVTAEIKSNRDEISTALQVITTLAVVGILINNRRSFKFTKKVIKNMDKNAAEMQTAIKALKEAGQTFSFYPGVGLWVD